MARWIRILPPRVQAWLVDYGGLSLFLAGLAVAGVALIAWTKNEPLEHDGFHLVEVDSTTSISDDGFHLGVFFHLDGAGPYYASTTSLVLAQTIVETACVERRKGASGRLAFRLVAAPQCGPLPPGSSETD